MTDVDLIDSTLEEVAALPGVGRSWATAFGYKPKVWPLLARLIGEMNRPVKVLSAGCQLGTETYTLAMHLLDAGIEGVEIVATDACKVVLSIADRAIYEARQVAIDVAMGRLSSEMFARYFRPVGDRHVQVVDEVRAMVRVVREPRWAPHGFESADVMLLRNVWVHLDPIDRISLVGKIDAHLAADGLVFLRSAFFEEVDRVMCQAGHRYLYRRSPNVSDMRAQLDLVTMPPAAPWVHHDGDVYMAGTHRAK